VELTGAMEAARDAGEFLQPDREFRTFVLDAPSMAIAHDEHRMLARAMQAGDGAAWPARQPATG
jgi:hypothetical protein